MYPGTSTSRPRNQPRKGRVLTVDTLRTPGRPSTRRSTSSLNVRTPPAVGYFRSGSQTCIVNRRSVRKPGSTRCRFHSDWMRSAAPASSTTESASSTTSSARPPDHRPGPALTRRVSVRLVRIAGNSPKSSVVSTTAAVTNASTR